MTRMFRDLAIAASTAAILTGSAAQAQENTAVTDLDRLNLPIGEEPLILFNESTQTVFIKECYEDIQNDNKVVCEVDAIANAALMRFEQLIIYTKDDHGNLVSVTPGVMSQGTWSSEYDGGDYKRLKEQATIVEWSASSPLATKDSNGIVVQNNVRQAHMETDYRACATSSMPFAEGGGFILKQCFEDKTNPSFQFSVNVTSGNGSILTAESGVASRPFVEGDYDFVERYYRNSLVPSYTVGQ